MLTRVKGNLARGSNASATFTITENAVAGGFRAPLLERGEDAQITADDVVADHETRSARDEAVEWLQATLANGPVATKHVQRQAREAGIADRTLRRAKVTLRVVSEQDRSENGITGWNWCLPGHSYTNGHVGHVGHLGHVGKMAKEAKNAKVATHIGETTKLGLAGVGV